MLLLLAFLLLLLLLLIVLLLLMPLSLLRLEPGIPANVPGLTLVLLPKTMEASEFPFQVVGFQQVRFDRYPRCHRQRAKCINNRDEIPLLFRRTSLVFSHNPAPPPICRRYALLSFTQDAVDKGDTGRIHIR